MSDCAVRPIKIRPSNNPLHGIKFEEFFTNPELYLCGEPLKKVMENQFFSCLNHHVDCGLCYAEAALAMFMLRDNSSARIIQGWARGLREDEITHHSWVECKYNNEWYVIDFAWLKLELLPIPKDWYYSPVMTNPKVIWKCGSRKFWQYDFNQLNFECLSRPETSWILPQLLRNYRPEPNQGKKIPRGFWFPPDHSKWRDSPQYGRVMVPQVFHYTHNGGLINQHIVREFMKPGLKEVSPQMRWKAEDQYRRILKRTGLKYL